MQARLNSLLAFALAIGVGIAMLAWYYGETLRRPGGPPQATRAAVSGRGWMSLPPLGPVLVPRTVPALAPAAARDASVSGLPHAPAEVPLGMHHPLTRWGGGGIAIPAVRSTAPHRLTRRLSGPVFKAARLSASRLSPAANRRLGGAALPNLPRSSPNALDDLLRPIVRPAAHAELLPQQRLLLPKGAFIDCTLETAIDSTLPGMTTCVTATDTFSADGTVVLLERGTKLIGETRGELHQGSSRVFVIWTEARTPEGVVVRLDSPGTDALGRAGLGGKVNRHFWLRFGAALLVSTIDGVVQSRLQSSHGTLIVEPAASEDVMTEALRNTVDIPPTVIVPNGARIQVLVARDVDFSSVYALLPR